MIERSVQVINRRAEMAEQCECLAAWDDERNCICDKNIEVPFSTDKLREANSLLSKIEVLDGYIKRTKVQTEDPFNCGTLKPNRKGGRGIICAHELHWPDEEIYQIYFQLPKNLVLAALNDQRLQLMEKLAQTGIVSVDKANVRSIPK